MRCITHMTSWTDGRPADVHAQGTHEHGHVAVCTHHHCTAADCGVDVSVCSSLDNNACTPDTYHTKTAQ